MTGLLRLGVRLAGVGGPQDRLRAGLTLLSGLVAGWLLMNLFAISAAERAAGLLLYSSQELRRVYLVVIVVFALPVVVLLATTSRLSAAMRDRRLATFRLLGLSPGQTRLVAAVEASTMSGVGAIVGVAAFYLTRPAVQASGLAGRDWEGQPFAPSLVTTVLILLVAPLTSVLVALVPASRIAPLARARRAAAPAPSRWRVAPLAAGVVIVGWATAGSDGSDGNLTNAEFYSYLAGVALVGLGILLCVPVLVRLLAAVMLAVTRRPTARVAARRLQSQPAGVARVVSGMLIGLFIVSGAQCVIMAFAQAYNVDEVQQRLQDGPAAGVPTDAVPAVMAEVGDVEGVRHGFMQTSASVCSGRPGRVNSCLSAFVGTCADLASLGLSDCDESRVAWLYGRPSSWHADAPTRWRINGTHYTALPPSTSLDWPQDVVRGYPELGDVFIPKAVLDGAPPAMRLDGPLMIVAEAGVSASALTQAVHRVAPRAYVYDILPLDEYNFVRGLQTTAWAAAGVILAIGLFTFAISAVDRAVSRRQEVVSLQVLGTPRRVLRTAQWIEAWFAVGVGLPLAVTLGWWCGRGYLVLGDQAGLPPTAALATLAGVSVLAAVVVAGLTALAASPRIRADLIRTT